MSAATITRSRRNMSAETPSAEMLCRETGRLLEACGVQRTRSWISRFVRDYCERVQHTGYPFGPWLMARVELNAEQRRRAMADPECHSFLSYSDPTGETAVRNAMRRHG